jgi:hypothetical protein
MIDDNKIIEVMRIFLDAFASSNLDGRTIRKELEKFITENKLSEAYAEVLNSTIENVIEQRETLLKNFHFEKLKKGQKLGLILSHDIKNIDPSIAYGFQIDEDGFPRFRVSETILKDTRFSNIECYVRKNSLNIEKRVIRIFITAASNDLTFEFIESAYTKETNLGLDHFGEIRGMQPLESLITLTNYEKEFLKMVVHAFFFDYEFEPKVVNLHMDDRFTYLSESDQFRLFHKIKESLVVYREERMGKNTVTNYSDMIKDLNLTNYEPSHYTMQVHSGVLSMDDNKTISAMANFETANRSYSIIGYSDERAFHRIICFYQGLLDMSTLISIVDSAFESLFKKSRQLYETEKRLALLHRIDISATEFEQIKGILDILPMLDLESPTTLMKVNNMCAGNFNWNEINGVGIFIDKLPELMQENVSLASKETGKTDLTEFVAKHILETYRSPHLEKIFSSSFEDLIPLYFYYCENKLVLLSPSNILKSHKDDRKEMELWPSITPDQYAEFEPILLSEFLNSIRHNVLVFSIAVEMKKYEGEIKKNFITHGCQHLIRSYIIEKRINILPFAERFLKRIIDYRGLGNYTIFELSIYER